MEQFEKLGLSKDTIQALKKKGFTEPTEVQSKVIPLLLEGKVDVVGQSQTGTGKTAAFALPILEKIQGHSKTVQAIILTPTRELALQVSKEIDSLKGDNSIKVLAVYGGAPIMTQRQKLREGVDIVVGTPGRVMDLQNRRSLKLEDIKYAVLDEADEMLNMGFVEDIQDILKNTPKDKSMLLFSATMPKPILRIAEKYMRDYELIEIEKANIITKTVEQIYYDVNAKDRVEVIRRIVDYYMDFHGIVFCNTKAAVDTLTHNLTKMNYSAATLHGDITQSQREKILQQFKNKYVKILVATDVAARGIDVNDLTHVINFSLPQSPEAYVHRIGRTGRAGKKGIAITLVIPSERRKINFVERINNCKILKQTIPSAKDIIENKEVQIKNVIEKIIEANTGKPSKYTSMAEELLKEHTAEEVVSAVLKNSFKNDLNLSSYKELADPKATKSFSDSDKVSRRGSRSSRGRGDRNSSYGRSSGRSSDRNSSRGRSDGRSSGRSSDRSFSRGRSEGRSDGRSSDRSSSRGRSEGRDSGKSFGRSSDRSPSRGRSEGRDSSRSSGSSYKRSEGRDSGKSSDRSSSRDFKRSDKEGSSRSYGKSSEKKWDHADKGSSGKSKPRKKPDYKRNKR